MVNKKSMKVGNQKNEGRERGGNREGVRGVRRKGDRMRDRKRREVLRESEEGDVEKVV